jgi:hypothetical protein
MVKTVTTEHAKAVKNALGAVAAAMWPDATFDINVVPRASYAGVGYLVLIPLAHRLKMYRYLGQHAALGIVPEGSDVLTITCAQAAQLINLSGEMVELVNSIAERPQIAGASN